MSRSDIDRLFDRLESLSVGFGPLFRDFKFETSGYPPHNIVKVDDSEFYIELAVAGFKKSEISIEEHQGVLTISGNKTLDPSQDYQFRGIASRDFSKTFRIAEYYEVADATLEDGILRVKFLKNVPEEVKPKLIAIK
jgi:molecular chaperone IbpA